MPVSRTDVLTEENFLSAQEVMSRLAERDELSPMDSSASRSRACPLLPACEAGATVGFIGAMTTSDFCAGCNKIRLTADGKIRPCLGRHNELDLLGALRRGEGRVEQLLGEAIAAKPGRSRVPWLLSARAADDGHWRISAWGSFACFFASARQAAGCAEATVACEARGNSRSGLWERLLANFPSLASLRGSVRVAKNCEYLAAGEDFRRGRSRFDSTGFGG